MVTNTVYYHWEHRSLGELCSVLPLATPVATNTLCYHQHVSLCILITSSKFSARKITESSHDFPSFFDFCILTFDTTAAMDHLKTASAQTHCPITGACHNGQKLIRPSVDITPLQPYLNASWHFVSCTGKVDIVLSKYQFGITDFPWNPWEKGRLASSTNVGKLLR